MHDDFFPIPDHDFIRFILAFRSDGQHILLCAAELQRFIAILHEQKRCDRIHFDEGIAIIDGKFCHGLNGRNLEIFQYLPETGGASAEELRLRFFKDIKRGVYKSPSTVRAAISTINHILEPYGCYLEPERGKYKISFNLSKKC